MKEQAETNGSVVNTKTEGWKALVTGKKVNTKSVEKHTGKRAGEIHTEEPPALSSRVG